MDQTTISKPTTAPHHAAVRKWAACIAIIVAALSCLGIRHGLAASIPQPADESHIFLPLVVQGVRPALPTVTATWGAPIVVSPTDGSVWVANPDAGSISRIDPDQLTKTAEIAVGGEPWSVALAPTGNPLYAIDRSGGQLIVVDTAAQTVTARIPVGLEPSMVALTPDGATAYIPLTAAGALAVVDTAQLTVTTTIAVAPHPYAVAATTDPATGQGRIYVTHLLALPKPDATDPSADDSHIGAVTVIDAASQTVLNQINLAPDQHGYPNLLTGISISGSRAWIPITRASPAPPNRLTTTIFAAVAALDLADATEDVAAGLPLNDLDIFGSPVNGPAAAVASPDGATLYIVLAGSNLVEIVDIQNPTQPHLVQFLPAGHNPRGLALSADGRRGYVMNYLSRSVSVLDLESRQVIAEISVTHETLAPDVLLGKQLFNTSADPRMTKGSWIACASCHPDGGTDGATWRFPDGPRQTPAIWSAGRTLPWHWTAAFDEPQDIEKTITAIQFGLGLAQGADPDPLGAPNTGRSADLDAVAAYLEHGLRLPNVPDPASGAAKGRQLFTSAGCAACHGGPNWTISALPGAPGGLDLDGNGMVDPVLRAVGTQNPLDASTANAFDVPSLLDVGLTAPYLHDGSLSNLDQVLRSGHPNPTTRGNQLTPDERADLVAFLNSIGPNTTPELVP